MGGREGPYPRLRPRVFVVQVPATELLLCFVMGDVLRPTTSCSRIIAATVMMDPSVDGMAFVEEKKVPSSLNGFSLLLINTHSSLQDCSNCNYLSLYF